MSQTRTGATVKKLVADVQEDLGDITDLLGTACDKMRQLETETRGINGTASMLKAKRNALEKMIADLKEESTAVAEKMLGQKRPEIRSNVDAEQAAKVKEARK